MTWKKINKSKDFLCFEKASRKIKTRLEARLEKGVWKVYKIYFGDNLRLVEEFIANDGVRLKKLLKRLMDEKEPSKSKIAKIIKEQKNSIEIPMKRSYKEFEFEKWCFGIDKSEKENVLLIHYGEKIEMDVILNEKYRHIYSKILQHLEKTLGIDGADKDVNIYYYNHQFSKKEKYKKPDFLLGKIEIDMGMNDEDS